MAGASYVGKAGQLAVMAEFLLRGYNVAMPEVDVGDDIFVVADRSGQLWRIQVKTALGKRRHYGWSAKFALARPQLLQRRTPDLYYVFALRAEDHWEFVLIPRPVFADEHNFYGIGSLAADNLVLAYRFRQDGLLCSGRDHGLYWRNWSEWPPLTR